MKHTKAKAKSLAAPRQKAVRSPSDTGLIRDCVVYAQSVAARENGFKADPTGNCDFAAPLGDKYLARASDMLFKIAVKNAKTAEGLQAKARIASMVIPDEFRGIGRVEEAFLRSFALDVKEFLEPIIHPNLKSHSPAADDRGVRS